MAWGEGLRASLRDMPDSSMVARQQSSPNDKRSLSSGTSTSVLSSEKVPASMAMARLVHTSGQWDSSSAAGQNLSSFTALPLVSSVHIPFTPTRPSS